MAFSNKATDELFMQVGSPTADTSFPLLSASELNPQPNIADQTDKLYSFGEMLEAPSTTKGFFCARVLKEGAFERLRFFEIKLQRLCFNLKAANLITLREVTKLHENVMLSYKN